MGIFKQFNNSFKDGWRRAESESYRKRCEIHEKEMAQRKRYVELIEPNHGNILTFKINVGEENMPTVIEALKHHLEAFKAEVTVNSNILTVKCQNFQIAQMLREAWK